MIDPNDLYQTPNALAEHYTRFAIGERLLLTGHSHQAWPDCGFVAQQEAWLDAARLVDHKWEAAFAKAERVRRGYAKLLGDSGGDIALGANTHELVVRFLSGLALDSRPRLVTTDGEFHTIRRQLDRLEESGLEIARVAAHPVDTLAERLAVAADDRTAAVLVSSVLYESARIVPNLGHVMQACERVGAALLVDAYHQLNVVPINMEKEGLGRSYITGAGYKYCQLGEGNGFLRLPPGCNMRPAITGWFSEFAELSEEKIGGVPYGAGPARFAGATYDPTSNYRAAAVFDFFESMGLAPEVLREVSLHQIAVLRERFDALDLEPSLIDRDRSTEPSQTGGFLALRSTRAGEFHASLGERGVFTDYRGATLRLGPAPYLSDAQLVASMDHLGEVARTLASG